jgi:hypothetical protein
MDEIVNDIPVLVNIDGKMIHCIGRKKIGDSTEDIMILNLAYFLDLES